MQSPLVQEGSIAGVGLSTTGFEGTETTEEE